LSETGVLTSPESSNLLGDAFDQVVFYDFRNVIIDVAGSDFRVRAIFLWNGQLGASAKRTGEFIG
jgi:hypothetical protein